MKKLLATMFLCLLTVTVFLKTGTEFKADKVVRFLDNAVIVQKGEKHYYFPNDAIDGVEYEAENNVRYN